MGDLAEAALRPLLSVSPEQRRRMESFFGSVGRQWELEQALGAAELRAPQQSEALEWYKQELADYGLIKEHAGCEGGPGAGSLWPAWSSTQARTEALGR